MTQKKTFCFELYLKNSISNFSHTESRILVYETLLSSLTQEWKSFVFSLRHLYNPLSNQKLRSFLLVRIDSGSSDDGESARVEGLLRGSLSRFYILNSQSEKFIELNWINSISELTKYGEFVEEPEFIGYLPHTFPTNLISHESSFLELLEDIRCEKMALEFSLESYNSPSEQTSWRSALEDLADRLSKCNSKSNTIKYALELYRNYQSNYTENQIFTYSIKALGCNPVDTHAILQALAGLTGRASAGNRRKTPSISTYTPQSSDLDFQDSLEATQNVQILQRKNWNGWETTIGRKIEKKLIKETIRLGSWDKGSLNFPILPPNFEQLNQSQKADHALLGSSESTLDPDSSDLVLGASTSLSKIFNFQIPRVGHLRPLHHITTFQEVAGFLNLFSLSVSTQNHDAPSMSAEEIFNEYRHLITRDTYIVGLDDNNNPIISSWTEIPHRLIAGLPGSGKTNFLNWIVFQFLYVNPKRKIYIADFGGVDFQHLDRLNLNIKIVDTPEDCRDLVENIHHEEYERRLDLMKKNSVSDLKLLQKEGVDIDRTLWIIDEAADIADSSIRLRESIERRLKEYARKGRKYGLHILYCTQRPTAEVITKQVTDQCEEKTIFRVTPGASQRILDDTIAGNIPKDSRGRAWLDGYAGRMFVNVPKMEKPEGSTIPIANTLWRHFISH